MDNIELLYDEIMTAHTLEELFGGNVTQTMCDHMRQQIDPGNFINDLDEKQLAQEALEKFEMMLMAHGKFIVKRRASGILRLPSGNEYHLLDAIGNSTTSNLYLCSDATDRPLILKVASSTEKNALLDREVMILSDLRERSMNMDFTRTGTQLNFHAFFPDVVESAICPQQGDRRVTILGFSPKIENISAQLASLRSLIYRDDIYVDPRTGAWMFGKLLKTLSFAHLCNVTNNAMTIGNVLVEKEMHGVIIFDWTKAEFHNGTPAPEYLCRIDIITAAKSVMHMMGASSKGCLPPSDQLADHRFEKMMNAFMQGNYFDAHQAHAQFYDLIWELWPRAFHPFTSYARNTLKE